MPSVASPGTSPYPPLSAKQVKQLKAETRTIRSQINLISDVVTQMYGRPPEHKMVVTSPGAVIDTKPESRAFSALTAEDYDLLNPGENGVFMYNQKQLNKRIPGTNIPNDFWPSLQTLRLPFSRQVEMGVRQIIGHFLLYHMLSKSRRSV